MSKIFLTAGVSGVIIAMTMAIVYIVHSVFLLAKAKKLLARGNSMGEIHSEEEYQETLSLTAKTDRMLANLEEQESIHPIIRLASSIIVILSNACFVIYAILRFFSDRDIGIGELVIMILLAIFAAWLNRRPVLEAITKHRAK